MKITLENQAMLGRLQGKQSVYNVVKWEIDELSRKKWLNSIREYPSNDELPPIR